MACDSVFPILGYSSSLSTFATTHSFSANSPVYSASGEHIATSWDDAIANTGGNDLLTTIGNATSPETFWTGFNQDGTVALNTCSGWTVTGGRGAIGDFEVLTTDWKGDGPIRGCAFSFKYLCSCVYVGEPPIFPTENPTTSPTKNPTVTPTT